MLAGIQPAKVNIGRCHHGNSAIDFSIDSRNSDSTDDLCHTCWGFAALIASGSDKWESEEQAQYERFNPHVKPVREVHHKELAPPQEIKTTLTIIKSPEKAAVSGRHPGKITLVSSVMVKTPYWCQENQSGEEALKIMLDHGLPYLPVLDSNLRVVGVVRLIDLMRSREQKDPPQSGGIKVFNRQSARGAPIGESRLNPRLSGNLKGSDVLR